MYVCMYAKRTPDCIYICTAEEITKKRYRLSFTLMLFPSLEISILFRGEFASRGSFSGVKIIV